MSTQPHPDTPEARSEADEPPRRPSVVLEVHDSVIGAKIAFTKENNAHG